jgi:succinate dehydrogenase/fumarate reductase flavoprotein subunit
MPDLFVAGAGMAGLAAAAEARRLGAAPMVMEKLGRPGGSMRLSSGVIWRHREFESFRAECRDGDPRLQRLVFDRLDEDLAWLESLGAPVVRRETGNPLTTGTRFDPDGLTETLFRAAGGLWTDSAARAGQVGGVELNTALDRPLVGMTTILATGGFAASRELLREHVTPEADHVLLRTASGSTGDGLRIGLAAGASLSAGLDEVYARAMPAPPRLAAAMPSPPAQSSPRAPSSPPTPSPRRAPSSPPTPSSRGAPFSPPTHIGERDFVRLSQLYAKHARVTNAHGEGYEVRTWSEIDVAQWQLRQPRARAWFTVPADRLGERVRERTVAEMIEAAEEAGAPVRRGEDDVTVETVAGVTTTLGGLSIDEHARVLGADDRPIDGLFACGADAGGIATGGYASGLAAALVFGRIAARAALGETT